MFFFNYVFFPGVEIIPLVNSLYYWTIQVGMKSESIFFYSIWYFDKIQIATSKEKGIVLLCLLSSIAISFKYKLNNIGVLLLCNNQNIQVVLCSETFIQPFCLGRKICLLNHKIFLQYCIGKVCKKGHHAKLNRKHKFLKPMKQVNSLPFGTIFVNQSFETKDVIGCTIMIQQKTI